jgi:hypothetical protein
VDQSILANPLGEPKYNDLERRLAERPVITVPTITLEGDANPEALHKQVLFIFEFGVEARFVHPGHLFQFMKTGVGKTPFAKKPASLSLRQLRG